MEVRSDDGECVVDDGEHIDKTRRATDKGAQQQSEQSTVYRSHTAKRGHAQSHMDTYRGNAQRQRISVDGCLRQLWSTIFDKPAEQGRRSRSQGGAAQMLD